MLSFALFILPTIITTTSEAAPWSTLRTERIHRREMLDRGASVDRMGHVYLNGEETPIGCEFGDTKITVTLSVQDLNSDMWYDDFDLLMVPEITIQAWTNTGDVLSWSTVIERDESISESSLCLPEGVEIISDFNIHAINGPRSTEIIRWASGALQKPGRMMNNPGRATYRETVIMSTSFIRDDWMEKLTEEDLTLTVNLRIDGEWLYTREGYERRRR